MSASTIDLIPPQPQPTNDQVEAPAPRRRREFSDDFKLNILRQADARLTRRELTQLLRRESITAFNLRAWQKQRQAGRLILPAETPTNGSRADPGPLDRWVDQARQVIDELARLRAENDRLRQALQQARLVINQVVEE